MGTFGYIQEVGTPGRRGVRWDGAGWDRRDLVHHQKIRQMNR